MSDQPATAPVESAPISNLKILFFYSRVGRRLMVLFLVAALIPVSVLGLALFLRIGEFMQKSHEAEMMQATQAYGALALERLTRIKRDLESIDASSAKSMERWTGSANLGREILGVTVVGPDNRVLRTLGRTLDARALQAVAAAPSANRIAFIAIAGDNPTVALVRTVHIGNMPARVVALIDPRALWAQTDSDSLSSDFCVGLAAGATLYCTKPAALSFASRFGAPTADTVSDTRWSHNGEPMRAISRLTSLQPALAGQAWVVTAIRSEQPLLQTADSFRANAALVAGLAVVLALLLSLNQMRRILVPLERLLLGAQSIAERNFSVRIPVPTRDEFGRVAAAFNTMAERLGLHFRTLDMFSEVDKTILVSPDIGKVAKLALDALKSITGAEFISVGLAEPGSPGQLRLFVCEGPNGELAPTREIAWNPDPKLFVGPAAGGVWEERPLLPNGYLQALKTGTSSFYLVLPIARNRRVWGLIVLGHSEPTPLTEDRRVLMRDIADRLAVALSTAERDRRLHLMAHLDGLTGLPNRQHILTVLEQGLAQAHANNSRVAVLFVDLDRFKETNDTLGHSAGDTLLKRASERIRESLRDSDQVGRHGGDEFTVILNDIISAKDAGNVARKLVKAMAKPFEVEGHQVYAGASVGVAIYPDHGKDGADLVKKADTAMYRAKEKGRGRYAFFEHSMNVEMNRRVTLDRELRQAIESDQFVLFYQPQFDLRSGRMCGAEALLRWQHPVRGLLAPSTFIELAEETGLIEQLGKWVLREACLQHGRWVAEGVRIPRVAVNVSSRQLRQPEFVPSVYYTMAATRMEPDSLEVEVTESLIIDGGEAAIAALRALEKAAARVAIDDFGTGYSSFTYLKTLPASILKLDKSFIVNVTTDKDAMTIAAAIINMAHTLRKEVVAEGVETAGQLEFLRTAGCEKAQGYYLSPPLPANKLSALAQLSATEGLDAVIETTRQRMNRIAARAAQPKVKLLKAA